MYVKYIVVFLSTSRTNSVHSLLFLFCMHPQIVLTEKKQLNTFFETKVFSCVFQKMYTFNSCKINDMSQSIVFICARSAKENLLSTLFNYRYNYKK